MKKFLCISISLLILSSYTVYAADNSEMLRVGISYGTDAVSQCSLESSAGFLIGIDDNRVFSEQMKYGEAAINVTMSTEGICTYGNDTFDTNSGQRLTFMAADGGLVRVNGKEYRGGIEILNAGGGKMAVINLISPDDYIKGVIGREMSSSWHIEALKAQAVCARNYAISNKGKHNAAGFDVCPTVHCQVYGGVAAEAASTIRASDETKGRYLMYNGALADTLFFSCDGGHTSTAKYVWGNDVPYLRGVEDIYENPSEATRYNWSTTLTTAEIEAKLLANGVNIGKVTAVTATAEPTTGQVYKLTITGTTGTKEYTNDGTRTWAGSATLFSQRYTVTPVSADASAGTTAITSAGKEPLAEFMAIFTGGKAEFAYPFIVRSAAGNSTVNQTALAYRFDGHGWGHGLGMSQYGAKAMADRGFSYEQILAFYYPGTNLQ